MGIRFIEVIQHEMIGRAPGNVVPYAVDGVGVNLSHIVHELKQIYQDNQYDYKQKLATTNYYEQEGIFQPSVPKTPL